jgi:hypothetical protein
MKKIIKLTESDLTRIVERVINEAKNWDRLFSGAPSDKRIENAKSEIDNFNGDPKIVSIFNDLYDAYENEDSVTLEVNGNTVNLNYDHVKELFYEMVQVINKKGVDDVRIGYSENYPRPVYAIEKNPKRDYLPKGWARFEEF